MQKIQAFMGTTEENQSKTEEKKIYEVVIFGHCFFHYGAEQISGNKLNNKIPFNYTDVAFMKEYLRFNAVYTEVGMLAYELKNYVNAYLGEYTPKKEITNPVQKIVESKIFIENIFNNGDFGNNIDENIPIPNSDQVSELMFASSQRQNKPEQVAFILVGDNDIVTFAHDLANKEDNVIRHIKTSIENLKAAGITKIILVGSSPPVEGSEVYHNVSKDNMDKIRNKYSDQNLTAVRVFEEMNKSLSSLATNQNIKFLQIPENSNNVGKREQDGWHYKDYRKLMKWIIEEGCKLYEITKHPLLEHLKRKDYLKAEYFNLRDENSQETDKPQKKNEDRGYINERKILKKEDNPFLNFTDDDLYKNMVYKEYLFSSEKFLKKEENQIG